jgi:hypothetical protein
MKRINTHRGRSLLKTLIKNQVNLVGITLAVVASTAFVGVAVAQSGHFVQTQTCIDTGTTVTCSGKVAGLGGTTFEIKVTAVGEASVQCRNPGGNIAPGQSFETTVTGTTDPLPTPRSGQFRYTITTDTPIAPADACPNPAWTAEVVDVEFTKATLTLSEDGVQSDTETVGVQTP